MGIFDKDLIENEDQVVLAKYNFTWDSYYKVNCLSLKDTYLKLYPADVIWKEYNRNRGFDKIRHDYGFNIKRDINIKSKFYQFIKETPLIAKIKFRGELYYGLSILWPMIDEFNKLLVQESLKDD